ncbi:hypothetical protein HDU84_001212 [Entophlyctis sp. JEL0112]|nr:hypothetical protein HDU84_001212 [Entophlyctis sp. JEL0112]
MTRSSSESIITPDLAAKAVGEAGKVINQKLRALLGKFSGALKDPVDTVEAAALDGVLRLVHLIPNCPVQRETKDDAVDDRMFTPSKTFQLISNLHPSDAKAVLGDLFAMLWQDLPKKNRQFPALGFRAADGSNNFLSSTGIGAANTPYSRTVTPSVFPLRSELPDAGELFDDLFARPADPELFEPNVQGVNSLLFAFATVITHDLFRSKPGDPGINQTTSYADLSCIYGATQKEQNSVRTFSNGFLKADTFTDPRLQFQPPAVIFLLALFCRNHNFIASKLLSDEVNVAEGYRFTHENGKNSAKYSAKKTDELVFQTARNINVACYAQLILHEYIKSITGIKISSDFAPVVEAIPPFDASNGNVVSIEFGYVYRWHSAISLQDEQWLKTLPLAKYLALRKQFLIEQFEAEDGSDADMAAAAARHGAALQKILPEFGVTAEDLKLGPICIGHHRDPKTGKFSDTEMVNVLAAAMQWPASKMGARRVPVILKEIEVEGIENARKLKLCTLNEFRRYFRVKPYKSYREMLTGPQNPNPDPSLIAAFEKHYGKDGIERVELYPGLVCDACDNDGAGLPLSMIRGILADAVNLIKNDRFLVFGLNPNELTHFGMDYISKTGDGRSDGSLFRKLVKNCFPNVSEDLEEKLKDPFHVYK